MISHYEDEMVVFYFMMTSSNEKISALLAICGEFPAQWPVTRSFDVVFDLCLN